MNNDAKLIVQRANELFKRLPRTQYHLQCTDDIYDKQYNFFFITIPKGKRTHSDPLHSITIHDLGYLEEVIKDIQSQLKLTIEYTGFTGQVWPVSQKVIQRKRRWDE